MQKKYCQEVVYSVQGEKGQRKQEDLCRCLCPYCPVYFSPPAALLFLSLVHLCSLQSFPVSAPVLLLSCPTSLLFTHEDDFFFLREGLGLFVRFSLSLFLSCFVHRCIRFFPSGHFRPCFPYFNPLHLFRKIEKKGWLSCSCLRQQSFLTTRGQSGRERLEYKESISRDPRD